LNPSDYISWEHCLHRHDHDRVRRLPPEKPGRSWPGIAFTSNDHDQVRDSFDYR